MNLNYFDELDKVSENKGEEIINLLIHLTIFSISR